MAERTPIRHLSEIDSTNTECSRMAESGHRTPIWVQAARQTSGRGRLNRVWHSEVGNLYASGLYQFNEPPAKLAELGFAGALAVVDALGSYIPSEELFLKWPNDVLLGRGKLAGVLPQSGQTNGKYWLVIGIGINLAHAPDIPGRETACVNDIVKPGQMTLTPKILLPDLIAAFEKWVSLWQCDGFEPLRRAWIAKAYGLGKAIKTHNGQEGVFEDMLENGALLLRKTSGRTIEISAGEIFFADGRE